MYPLVTISTITLASILKLLLGVAHASTADDIYENVFIPKGDNMTKPDVHLLTSSHAIRMRSGGKYLVCAQPVFFPGP